MPVGSGKKATFVGYKSKRELSRLKADLGNHLCAVLAIGGIMSPVASRSDCVLELLSLSTRAAGSVCEAPALNFLEPLVGIAALICDTAKVVKSNSDAAVELTKHAGAVTKCVVDRASVMDAAAADGRDALEALTSALQDIQTYLTLLKKPRRRLVPWIFANLEKERFAQLNRALDKARQILSTAVDVRACEHGRDRCRPLYRPALGQ
ncbi:hypothetical protein B0H17DRAFT_555689 [Mycena rosella]|uniref:Uncharacterized protein n=1 Tax=Mycena rosella TaxID=1033263 RepID=A0AAD7DHD5_MYCRO|nr:hypothetical protein B0H17DRAFT_555689 [Mycena rosella]